MGLCQRLENRRQILALIRRCFVVEHPSLERKVFGLRFPNPVGLAAGFDKNATALGMMQALGFGHVEVGSVTARASAGNPKPRNFRLVPDESAINRMGLGNDGAEAVAARLLTQVPAIPIGINIAKTNDSSILGQAALEDYRTSLKAVKEVADFITLNISCPNTGDGRTFEEPGLLDQLLAFLEIGTDQSRPPVLIKFSVDLTQNQLAELIDTCIRHRVDGYVAVNTSLSRKGLKTPADRLEQIGPGGLSGRAIAERSTEFIARLHELSGGRQPIIGVGGIFNAADAIEKLDAGASLVQVYTGLIFEGPGIVSNINRGLIKHFGP
jgi:dihydroorotate dehydrogenase